MTNTTLRTRIASAIARVTARVTASKAADEVLAEIERTHVLIEREFLCKERLAAEATHLLNDSDTNWTYSRGVVDFIDRLLDGETG